jgi:hypothetical protein
MSGSPQQAMQQFAASMARDMAKFAEQLRRAMQEWVESPAGQYLLAVSRYYEKHPDELDAMIRAREAEAVRPLCSCLCQRWGHLGACQTYATTERVLYPDFGAVVVRACDPCAAGIDDQTGTSGWPRS